MHDLCRSLHVALPRLRDRPLSPKGPQRGEGIVKQASGDGHSEKQERVKSMSETR